MPIWGITISDKALSIELCPNKDVAFVPDLRLCVGRCIRHDWVPSLEIVLVVEIVAPNDHFFGKLGGRRQEEVWGRELSQVSIQHRKVGSPDRPSRPSNTSRCLRSCCSSGARPYAPHQIIPNPCLRPIPTLLPT